MLKSAREVVGAAIELFGEGQWPGPLAAVRALVAIEEGQDLKAAARSFGTTPKKLTEAVVAADPVAAVLGHSLVEAQSEKRLERARATVGALLLGVVAERVFEDIYKHQMGTDELRLEDDRSSRSDTDYRVLNGKSRPVFRINIKFHGAQFRNALDLVGLEPLDCFALATYKIFQGLQKQEKEVIPYLFVIVGVPHLTGAAAGARVPDRLVELVAVCKTGRRAVEERVVQQVLENQEELAAFRSQVERATWYVLSARRADKLLREKLFDRVYAVRVRGFAQNYRNAELDMHFSLRSDLTPLDRFLDELKARGLPGLTAMLERGLL